MNLSARPHVFVAALWLVLVALALYVRPLFPIDETRYVAVAWEMWLRGDFLVPHLNGQPYSHKPPFLFWMFQLGWGLFGVNEWWPRLVPPLFGLADLYLVAVLARRLWPDAHAVYIWSPLALFGCALWTVFTTFTMFDLLLVCFVLLGLIGIASAWRGNLWGFGLFGIALGLGMLTKGPVALIYTLPAALAAPWWAGARPARGWGMWYLGVVGALVGGAAMILAWALPAAQAGGQAYHDAILWSQTADRVVHAPNDREPWWWYLPLLPLVLFPWLLWPPLWRGFARVRREAADAGVRFCLAWMLPALVALSLFSGKKPHYLLPLFPAFALLAVHAMQRAAGATRRFDRLPAGMSLVVVGVLFALAPGYAYLPILPDWLAGVSPLVGAAVALSGGVLMLVSTAAPRQYVVLPALSAWLVLVAHLGVVPVTAASFDLAPVGRFLHAAQQEERPIAHVGKYFGQYQFVGRLTEPLEVIQPENVAAWFASHPRGLVISYERQDAVPNGKPVYQRAYRNADVVVIWDAPAYAAAHPTGGEPR